MKRLLFFLVCGTLVSSCTITKRHFGNGYHVEWNRKIKTGTDPEENSKIDRLSPTASVVEQTSENQAVLKSMDEPDSILEDKVAIHDQPSDVPDMEPTEVPEIYPVNQPRVWSGMEIREDREIKIKELKRENEPGEAPKSRMHPLMWGIWAMWSIAIACMFFVTFYAEFLIGVGIGFFIAMIFAIIVIRGLRKHPEKYGFKRLSYPFAILAIVFGGIALAGLLLFLGGGYGISY